MISFYHVIGPFDICLSNLLHLQWCVQTRIHFFGWSWEKSTYASALFRAKEMRQGWRTAAYCLTLSALSPQVPLKCYLLHSSKTASCLHRWPLHPSIAHGKPEKQRWFGTKVVQFQKHRWYQLRHLFALGSEVNDWASWILSFASVKLG